MTQPVAYVAGLLAATTLLFGISFANAQRFQDAEDASAARPAKSGATRDILRCSAGAADIMFSSDGGRSRSPGAVRGSYDAGHNDHRRRKAFLVVGRRLPARFAHPSGGKLEIRYGRRPAGNLVPAHRTQTGRHQTCLAYVVQNNYAEKDAAGAGAGVYSASSARPARRTAFTGPHRRAMRARLANSSRRPRRKDTKPGRGARPITATTIGY